jgi:molybdenum cofactor cytidylyltransferase
MKTAILILAAGESSRMGEAKQLLPIGNKTLLGIAIEGALKSKADSVYCVLGAHSEVIQKTIKHYSIKIIDNNEYQLGLSSSIIKGIDCLKTEHFDNVLIMLGDQPNVDQAYLNQLMDAHHNNPTKIITSSYDGSFGVPAIFPKSYFNQLLHLKGDKGAKNFLNSAKVEVLGYNSDQLTDIDTTKDYLDFLNSM